MPSWWGRSSSKEAKKKTSKESFIDTLHRKFKSPSEGKASSRSGGSQKHCSDTVSEKGSRSPLESRSPSPSKHVARCQSFAERPHAQPLPLPGVHPACVGRTNSGIGISTKPRLEKASKPIIVSASSKTWMHSWPVKSCGFWWRFGPWFSFQWEFHRQRWSSWLTSS